MCKVEKTTRQQRAIALRMVGASYSAISQDTGISISSLQHLFAVTSVSKSGVTKDAIIKARQEVLDDKNLQTLVANELRMLIRTEIAISSKIMEATALTLEQLQKESPLNRAKALPQLASTVLSASTIMRRAITIPAKEKEEVPVLEVEHPPRLNVVDFRVKR